MAYTLDFSLALGSGKAGKTLCAQLVDTAGGNVGSEIATGFAEIGQGNYLWHYASIPDAHRGGVRFYESGVPGTILAFAAINPEEAERVDVDISSRSTLTQADILSDAVPFAGASITAIVAYVDELESRLSAARAGYLDNLALGAVALASVCSEARLAELGAANVPTDVDTLLARLSAARAGYLDNLSAGAAALQSTLIAIEGAGWSTETLKVIYDTIAGLNDLAVQEVRDAMKLAPSAGSPATGSIDKHADDIQARTDLIDWDDIDFLVNIGGGRWRIVSDQMIFYKADNLTEIMRFNLKNLAGTPAMADVFERVRV